MYDEIVFVANAQVSVIRYSTALKKQYFDIDLFRENFEIKH